MAIKHLATIRARLIDGGRDGRSAHALCGVLHQATFGSAQGAVAVQGRARQPGIGTALATLLQERSVLHLSLEGARLLAQRVPLRDDVGDLARVDRLEARLEVTRVRAQLLELLVALAPALLGDLERALLRRELEHELGALLLRALLRALLLGEVLGLLGDRALDALEALQGDPAAIVVVADHLHDVGVRVRAQDFDLDFSWLW